ncbi:phosphatase PAP2 family protein [Ramlibacter sp.]|uniref:phosphatase PAP2 family protein n=1 Tax=Ramlibacter sp. TaxID=1917967 RepID=UPI0018103654|nr:phosphatase PAP2 family protein [Ramlibacter sp.]MBA2676552.1 phosphatase PAP2 family protein [Ramlibacter sp.]
MQRSSDAVPRGRLVAVFLVCVSVFAALAAAVFALHWFDRIDPAALLFLSAHRTPALTHLMAGISWAHETVNLLVLVALAAGWLWRRGKRPWAGALVLAVPGAMLLNLLLKNTFARVRPGIGDPLVHLHTFSFPSGHTTAATALYGWLCLFTWAQARTAGPRAAAAVFAVLMVGMVGLSRMYLGAHFPSDVSASVAAATAWLAMVRGALHNRA